MERRRGFDLRDELRVIAPLIGCWSVALVVLVVIASIDDPDQRLLLEPLAISAKLPWYAGLVPVLSLCAWGVAVTAAFGGSFVAGLAGREHAARFLRNSGLLTVLLMTDEILGLHYSLADELGFPKQIAVGVLVIACAGWAVKHADEIRRTRRTVLSLAVGAIFVALLIDRQDSDTLSSLFLEEGLQLLGVIGWATYFVVTAGDICRSVVQPKPVAAEPNHDVARTNRSSGIQTSPESEDQTARTFSASGPFLPGPTSNSTV